MNKYLHSKGIDSKIHYPIPLHLHKSAKIYKYKKGDFRVAEELTKKVISLPVHEFINKKQLSFMVNCIKKFHYEN